MDQHSDGGVLGFPVLVVQRNNALGLKVDLKLLSSMKSCLLARFHAAEGKVYQRPHSDGSTLVLQCFDKSEKSRQWKHKKNDKCCRFLQSIPR